MSMPTIEIYTDGACASNPGPGGYGIVMLYKDKNGNVHQKEFSKGFICTTNNRMELLAVIDALNLVKMPCKISLYSVIHFGFTCLFRDQPPFKDSSRGSLIG